jgi:tRNA threonylcarbamoyladenosine biosynthesis protein TsaE
MAVIEEYISNNLADTDKFAKKVKQKLKAGDVIALTGNLGSGKTYFVKKIVENFGVVNSSSPSFAIVNEYIGELKIYHFDFFRIKKISELYDIGFEEYFNDDSIIFIEWAEMFPDIIPDDCFKINIEILNNDERKFIIEKND